MSTQLPISGASKSARKATEERDRMAAIPALEPQFPYRAVPFDAFFFGVDRDADQQLEESNR